VEPLALPLTCPLARLGALLVGGMVNGWSGGAGHGWPAVGV